MEIQLTASFASAMRNHEAALDLANAGGVEQAIQDFRDQAEYERLFRLMMRRAETPSEIKAKLDLVFDRELFDSRGWDLMRDAVDRDIMRLNRPEPSNDMRAAFERWRTAAKALCEAVGDAIGDDRCHARSIAFRQVLAQPCASAGDFMVKAYLELLTEAGGAVGGNDFDPDTEEFANAQDDGEAYKRSVYADLDGCDLGACLLAFGRIHFNARLWVERAGVIGMPVVVQRSDAAEVAIQIMRAPQADPRIAREQERLIRLVEYDPRRVNQIVDLLDGNSPGWAEPIKMKAA